MSALGAAEFAARVEAYQADIDLAIAKAAHNGTSHAPEVRAASERESYAATLARDLESLEKLATTPEKLATLEIEFARYRHGYRGMTIAMLLAKSRCVSTMIAGGSNFPVRRQQKLSDTADKRTAELIDFRVRVLAAIRKVLQPELQPIMSGDADALERLRAKLVEAEQLQAKMTAANAAIRKHAKAGPAAQVAALVQLGHSERLATAMLDPDELGRIGFASYQLTNNNATIKRLRDRLAVVSVAKAAPDVVVIESETRFEDSPADNRVRLFFSGKPSVETRTDLKRSGFRWTPSLGCWQAYRSDRTSAVAQRIAKITKESRA